MLKGEKGIALFMALLIILISALLTALLAGISIINIKLSSNIANYKKAVYAAEAGREYARSLLMENAPNIPDINDAIILENGSSFNINIEIAESKPGLFIIESEGIYNNNKRVYKTDMEISNQ